MKSWFIFFCILSIGIMLPEAGLAKSEPAEKTEVWRLNELHINGASDERMETIKDKMALKPLGWKSWIPFKKKPEFTENLLEEDIQRIEALYNRWGYYDVSVTHEVTRNEEKKTVSVTINIVPGEPTHIRTVKIEGIGGLNEKVQEGIRKRIKLEPGKVFDQDNYDASKVDLLTYLGNHGFAKAEVDWRGVVVKATRQADIKITISPGKRYRFGPVTVSGLENIDPKVILAQVVFKEGEFYNADDVNQSQRNIYNLGAFNLVTINYGEPDPSTPDLLPIEIVTKPKKLRSVSFGLGYGTEDQVRARLSWQHRNFWGQARTFTVTAKYSSLVEAVEGNFKQPYFYGSNQYLTDNFGLRKDKVVSYTNQKAFNDFFVTRNFTNHLALSLGQSLEFDHLEDISVQDYFDQSVSPRDFFISSLKGALTYDSRNNVLDPTKGFYFQAGAEFAATEIGSTIGYLRALGEGRHYLDLPGKLILASRLSFGTIYMTQELDHPPIFKRFFVGGSNSVRGYQYQELGPVDSGNNPIGGESALEGSLELRYPIWKDLGGVVFVDFGQVSLTPFYVDFSDIRYTSGLGLRYKTPIGPVRIDAGYQLNPQPNESQHYAVYFSIGQAF